MEGNCLGKRSSCFGAMFVCPAFCVVRSAGEAQPRHRSTNGWVPEGRINYRGVDIRILTCAACLLLMTTFPRGSLAQQAGLVAHSGHELTDRYSGPIFDVHLHTDPPASAIGMPNPVTGLAAAADSQVLRDAVIGACNKYQITHAVLNGWPGTLQQWTVREPHRFILAPMVLNNDRTPLISVSDLKSEIQNGRAGAVGEIMSQYAGLDPNDPVLEPYWALAETMDVAHCTIWLHPSMHLNWVTRHDPYRNELSRFCLQGLSQFPPSAGKSVAAGGCSSQASKTAAVDCAWRSAMVTRDVRLNGSISPGVHGCFDHRLDRRRCRTASLPPLFGRSHRARFR